MLNQPYWAYTSSVPTVKRVGQTDPQVVPFTGGNIGVSFNATTFLYVFFKAFSFNTFFDRKEKQLLKALAL